MKILMSAALASMGILAGAFSPTARAAIIGFDGIIEAPVSIGNPYGGALNLEGRFGKLPWDDHGRPLEGAQELVWWPAMIRYEQIDTHMAAPGNSPWIDWLTSEITGTFTQPVTDVRFDAWTWWKTDFEYFGANAMGDVFSGAGTFMVPNPSNEFIPIELTLPSGYYLTHFKIVNTNAGPSSYSFRIDNIAFTLASGEQSVPDSGPTALLLGLSCAGLAAVRWRFPLVS